jgi:signal transduction histidine kinase
MSHEVKDREHMELLKRCGLRALINVPIRVRDRIFGVVALASAREGRRYDTTDLALAEELGRRAGMAIDNARLYMEAEAQRERLQKAVQSRDEFISIASHELKTPVTSLILHAEMAALQLERAAPAEELRERLQKFVHISGSQIDRLSRLIDEMLDVSRISNGRLIMEMEQVDLARLVKNVLEDFKEQLRETGSLASFQGEPGQEVRCDRYRIEQVVTNLLTNAMKYGEGRPIEVSLVYSKEQVELSVRDQGIGIDPVNHQRIFDRFERAVSATSVSGLGLGLYIVTRIVEAHRGSVRVESALGKGSIFTVALPIQ